MANEAKTALKTCCMTAAYDMNVVCCSWLIHVKYLQCSGYPYFTDQYMIPVIHPCCRIGFGVATKATEGTPTRMFSHWPVNFVTYQYRTHEGLEKAKTYVATLHSTTFDELLDTKAAEMVPKPCPPSMASIYLVSTPTKPTKCL